MSAEYLSKKYIKDHQIKDMIIRSAGTSARPENPFPRTVERLKFYGCDVSQHQQRKIEPNILAQQDLIICMTEHHRQSVRALGFDAVLFNEIAYNKTKDLLDDTEYANQYGPYFDIDTYMVDIVDYIHEAIPFVIENIFNRQKN